MKGLTLILGVSLGVAWLLLIFGNAGAPITFSPDPEKKFVLSNISSMPLAFTENRGQFGEKTLFKAEVGGATFFFCQDEVAYLFVRQTDELIEEDPWPFAKMLEMPDEFYQPRYKKEILLIKAQFIGAHPNAEVIGVDCLPHYNNYFIGNDPSKWRTNVPNYSAIVYKDIYNGIDLKYYGDRRSMKYDFMVQPGADLSQIKIRYHGVEDLSITPTGNLKAQTSFGLVYEKSPRVYQEIKGTKQELIGQYKLMESGIFGFVIGDDYDPSYPLVIDPTLVYSTYLGGTNEDWSFDIAVDLLGCVYVTGFTWSVDFDTTLAAYQCTLAGSRDVFVTKFSPFATGHQLLYSTYLGGEGEDWGFGIGVDLVGCAYVTGYTMSDSFPTVNAYDDTLDGEADCFVTKFFLDGATLVYSTYLGGSSYDAGQAIALDSLDNVYVTGMTYSTDFYTTPTTFQETNKGTWDAFVTQLDNNGFPNYSTYLGGSFVDAGYGIAVDDWWGYVWVTGLTWSDNFPTEIPYRPSLRGPEDAFVTKLDTVEWKPAFSTYLGGEKEDYAKAIAVGEGWAYVTGRTWSSNFDTTYDAYCGTLSGDCDAFLTKVRGWFPETENFIYSTYLGGSNEDCGKGIAVDTMTDFVYLTGRTESPNYPKTADAHDSILGGEVDVFVTKFGSWGSFNYSTYLGGSNDDYGRGIAVDLLGNVFVTGKTGSSDFDTTAGAHQTVYASNYDAFMSTFATAGNLLPVAVIDSIIPDTAYQNTLVSFYGRGVDTEGSVNSFSWRSDIDDVFCSQPICNTTTLTPAKHTIYFKVQDDSGGWSEEVSDTLVIMPVSNNRPTASIDNITPNPAQPGQTVIFTGSGNDENGNIAAYNWRSDLNGQLSQNPSFETSELYLGTHTIYFRVQDDDGAWSDETSQLLNIQLEEWLVSLWCPALYPWWSGSKMAYPYNCTLLATNITQKAQTFNYGIDTSYVPLDWYGEPVTPSWDLNESSSCILNGESYEFGISIQDTIAADDTKGFIFTISNEWNWIEPWSATRVLEFVISMAFSAITPFLGQLGEAFDFMGILEELGGAGCVTVPQIAYTYTGVDDATFVWQDTCWVSEEKIFYLSVSFITQYVSMIFTVVGGNFLATVQLKKAAVCFIAEAIFWGITQYYYIMAADPDSNYTEYAHPGEWDGPDIDLYDVGEGWWRSIAEKTIEMYLITQACAASYAKYLGALKDGSTGWATIQLGATYSYLLQQDSLSNELSSLIQAHISEIPDADPNAVRDSLRGGLPEAERDFMLHLGFHPDTVNMLYQIFVDSVDASPHVITLDDSLIEALGYLQSSIYTMACSLLFKAPGGAKIANLAIDPDTLYYVPPSSISCCIEFPGIDPDSLDNYKIIIAILNDVAFSFSIATETGDCDGDGIPDLLIEFDSLELMYFIETLQPGKQLFSVSGQMATQPPLSPDTFLYSGATTVTYLEICGDVNGDGQVTIPDVIYLVSYLFRGGPKPRCPSPYPCANANCVGWASISDAVYLVNYLFRSGPPPCDPDNDDVPDC